MTDDDDDINEYQHPIDGLDHWVNLLKGNDAFSYTYVSCSAGKVKEERKLSARDMRSRHRELAKMFTSEMTFSSNKRVIFLYEPGVDWFPVFLALMCASVVPCVVYPIDPMTTARDVLRERYEFLKTLAKECAGVVCSSKMATALKLTRLKLLDTHGLNCQMWVVDGFETTFEKTASEFREDEEEEKEPIWKRDPEATAFIQYTSGSTGKPKRVILSHRA